MAALALVLATDVVAQNAQEVINSRPPLRWSASDHTLDDPLGAIVDVAVGVDGTTHLLDSQACVVHRFDRSGAALSPLGRRGEGPGEFEHPLVLAVYGDGRCLVVQDFHARPVGFAPDGSVCDAPDVSAMRDDFFMTMFVRARVDAEDRLILGGFMSGWPSSGQNSDAMRDISCVQRLATARGGEAVVLFTTDRRPGAKGAVPRRHARFVVAGWDVNANGAWVYADPLGAYRVHVGDPDKGSGRTIDLQPRDSDEAKLKRAIHDAGVSVSANDVPRIVSVDWLDGDRLLVQPVAEFSPKPPPNTIGVFDVFGIRGTFEGRYRIHCAYDAEYDSYFIRAGRLIVIEGGRSAVDASVRLPGSAPPRNGGGPDEIAVRVYDVLPEDSAP